jgi:hypothetical protein
VNWLHEAIECELKARFFNLPEVRNELARFEREVLAGDINPPRAASELIKMSQ